MKKAKDIVVVTLLALFFSLVVQPLCHRGGSTSEPYRDTVRVTLVDTVTYYNIEAKDSMVIKYVTVRVPIKENDTPKEVAHLINEASKPDSLDIELPITQKVYEDSAYTAYVSGYMASLDSVRLRIPREIVTIKEPHKPKRWSIGVQAGYGMTLKGTPQFAPYVGIGVSYTLFSF